MPPRRRDEAADVAYGLVPRRRATRPGPRPCGACGERRGHLHQCPAVVPLEGLTAAQLFAILEPIIDVEE